MDIQQHFKQFLKDSNILSLATCKDGQPWACNAFYVSDEDMNLYFISHNTTRHVAELQDNSNVAITIYDRGAMPGLIKGAQMSGKIEELAFDEAVKALSMYQEKFTSKVKEEDLKEGETRRVYKFTPDKILFRDSESFEDRQEIK